MHRFYADAPIAAGALVPLTREDARHARQVLRMKAGDQAELFSGGERWLCRAEVISPDEALFLAETRLPSTEPARRYTLFQGLPKADKMEWIIQKAVELGACRVVPVLMARTVVRVDGRDAEKKRERWQRIAHEACKQSGRCEEPVVEAPIPMAELADRCRRIDAVAVPWEEARDTRLADFHRTHPDAGELALVIGPEGGIDAHEISLLRSAGCVPVTLGPRILRTETAGLAALSVLLSLYGDL